MPEMPDWNEYQDARREIERLIDRQRGAGFPLGAWLPVEQVDWHHQAIQHLREIDHLMQQMYNRGLRETYGKGPDYTTLRELLEPPIKPDATLQKAIEAKAKEMVDAEIERRWMEAGAQRKL